MPQIEIDFDVWKSLTMRRSHEKHTYNDVLRELLELDSLQEPEIELDPDSPMAKILDAIPQNMLGGQGSGFHSRNLYLPNGTKIRARYKGQTYNALIEGGKFLSEGGRLFTSPSMAAKSITGTNVNGLRFWEAQRPTDGSWQRLELLIQS